MKYFVLFAHIIQWEAIRHQVTVRILIVSAGFEHEGRYGSSSGDCGVGCEENIHNEIIDKCSN
jgi:hypothetical protein